MNTKILDGNNINNINYAIKLLDANELVAIPTETVYGLAANAYSDCAVEKIFKIKNRPKDNPLIIHVHSIDMILKIVKYIPNDAYKLFEAFSPGPLTIILKKNNKISNFVSTGLSSIGVRIPNHPITLNLLKLYNKPIAAPSANISGLPSTTTAQHVLDDMNTKISVILDGGKCNVGIESTIISFLDKKPIILRPGFISKQEIEKILNYKIEIYNETKSNIKLLSPGIKYKHYSPGILTILYIGKQKNILTNILNNITKENDAIITFNEYLSKYSKYKFVYSLGNEYNNIEHSKKIFYILRDLRNKKYIINKIHIHCPNICDKSLGIINRLKKAADYNIKIC